MSEGKGKKKFPSGSHSWKFFSFFHCDMGGHGFGQSERELCLASGIFLALLTWLADGRGKELSRGHSLTKSVLCA